MRNIAPLAVVAFAALVVVMAHAGPAYAGQTGMAVTNTNAGSAIDTVVGNESAVPVQLVRSGRGGGHGFRRGGFHGFHSGYRGARFHNYGFARHHHFRPSYRVYTPYYAGSYYYYNNGCWWNGYRWVCNYYYY